MVQLILMHSHTLKKILVRIAVSVNDTYLVLQRTAETKVNSELWELPGGKLDPNESIEQAACRELLEETGVKVTASNLQYERSESFANGELLSFFFVVVLDKKPPINLSEEHTNHDWIKSKAAYENIMSKETVYFFESVKPIKTEEKNTSIHSKEENIEMLKIYCDGGSRGNPGPSATGYVIYDKNDKELTAGGTYLGVTTNNQAEYQAVGEAAKVAVEKYQPKTIEFYLDSQLVVNQMKGVYKIRNKDLWPIHESIKRTLKSVHTEYIHVPRDQNTEADAMVNQVLDSRNTD